jgi:protein-tyrosine phosphatase
MLETQPARDIRLVGLHNLRDLGGYETRSGQVTRWRRVLRADSLHKLTPEARDELIALGVKTVIDLRHADELEGGPNVLADHADVRYINVPLFAGLSRSAADLAHSSGDTRNDAGSSQAAPPDLEMLYKGALERCRDAFREVITALSEPGDGVVLFHCTAGKDRTGLIAALVLGVLGVPDETIIADYALTAERIEPLLIELRADALAKGHDLGWYNRLLSAEPATMQATLEYLRAQYGGIGGYLETLGLDPSWREGLRARLLED